MTNGDQLWQPVLKTTPEQSPSPAPKKTEYLTPLDQLETPTPFRLFLFYFFILAALETVLAFSVYGLITMDKISVTTMHIPVLLAALFFGRRQGLALGLYFGLLTVIKASTAAFTPGIS